MGLGRCSKLSLLHVDKCERLAALPNSLAECKKLKSLHIRGCGALKNVPDLSSSKGLDIQCDDTHVEAFAGIRAAIEAFSVLQAQREAKREKDRRAALQERHSSKGSGASHTDSEESGDEQLLY